jgi:CubicO group peptidase (beta-lactamase class C family)
VSFVRRLLDRHGSALERDRPGRRLAGGSGQTTERARRDYVRFGLLYANEGRVGDRQVLPADWVAISTEPKVAPDYGYFWWIDMASATKAFAGRGNLGQLIYVVPDEDLVIVRFGERRGGVDWLALARTLAGQVAIAKADR